MEDTFRALAKDHPDTFIGEDPDGGSLEQAYRASYGSSAEIAVLNIENGKVNTGRLENDLLDIVLSASSMPAASAAKPAPGSLSDNGIMMQHAYSVKAVIRWGVACFQSAYWSLCIDLLIGVCVLICLLESVY